ncbi:hypothetical protein [Pseudomonas phage UF_RH7]|nr:hypothetical protein [Pseudomonas phage UF_RH7]
MDLKNIPVRFALEVAAFAGAGALSAKEAIEKALRAADRDYNMYDATGYGDRETVSLIVPAVVWACDSLYGNQRFNPPADTLMCYDYVEPCAGCLAARLLPTPETGDRDFVDFIRSYALGWMEDLARQRGDLKEENPDEIAPGLGVFKTVCASTDHLPFADYQLLKAHAYREDVEAATAPYWIINHPVGVQLQPVTAPLWADELREFGVSLATVNMIRDVLRLGYGAVLFHEDADVLEGVPVARDNDGA